MSGENASPGKETAWSRLRDLWTYSFTKDDYNDPHRPPPPEELREFGHNVVLLLGAGLFLGGFQQWLRERKHTPSPIISPTYSKAEAAKMIAELNTRKLIRVMNATLRGGLWCGWLGALYFGVEGLTEYARDVRDPLNTVMGAWASGAVFGYAIGGPGILGRLQSSSIAVFVAGLVAYPVGYLQVQFKEKTKPRKTRQSLDSTNDERTKSEVLSPYPVRDYDVVGAVISKLDASLKPPKKT